jgi:hypothetical protein
MAEVRSAEARSVPTSVSARKNAARSRSTGGWARSNRAHTEDADEAGGGEERGEDGGKEEGDEDRKGCCSAEHSTQALANEKESCVREDREGEEAERDEDDRECLRGRVSA